MKKFRVTRYQIPIDKKKYCLEGKIRIVLLSDLHNESYGKNNDVLIQEIHRQKPDLIAAAGDMLTSGEPEEEGTALRLLQVLAEKYPVYYGYGNHEHRMKLDTDSFGLRYERYAEAVREAGVFLLENECVDTTVKNVPLRIYGLQLPWRFYRRFCFEILSLAELETYLGKGTQERYQILLAHNPMCFAAYEEWGADLTLSGHLHGGFLRLPFLGGIVSPQCVPFPRYDRGIFVKNGHYMAVSAGLGSHSRIPRIGNPTELVVVDLFRKRC